MSYVYFLTDADTDGGFIKIGVSNDIGRRMAQLQSQVPFRLRCIEFIEATSQNEAYKIEHALHRHFKDRRLMREWFDIGQDEILPAAAAIGEQLRLGTPEVEDHKGVLPPRID